MRGERGEWVWLVDLLAGDAFFLVFVHDGGIVLSGCFRTHVE